MELKVQLTQNGQELQTDDVNTSADSAGLADDRLLAELLRLQPDPVPPVKAILPYGANGDSAGYQGTAPSTVFAPGTSDATVRINPFRAVVGSRTVAATDALKNWRDIRSGVFVGGGGNWSTNPPTSLTASQIIAANASGNARWDLIYALILTDTAANSVQRAVKAPTTGAVTTPTIATKISTQVSVGYLQGTPSANPALPATPADANGIYYVPLAYVTVPNGFGATSIVAPWMILPVATPGPGTLSKAFGGAKLSTPNAITQSTSALAAWANNSTVSISGRSPWVLPPEGPRGLDHLLVTIDLTGTNPNNWSHVNGALIDNSRDWRSRFFRTTIFVNTTFGGIADWAMSRQHPTNVTGVVPAYAHSTGTPEAMANNLLIQLGQSFRLDAPGLPGGGVNGSVVCFANSTILTNAQSGVGLYVDTNGVLRVYIVDGSTNNMLWFFWVEASGPMASY